MFENLSERLDRSFKLLKGEGKITEINVAETLKDVRKALLDADVNYKVAKGFTDTVKAKALGQNVLTSVKPSQLMVKIVHDELADLMGGTATDLDLKGSPAIILMSGLQGSGKTTFSGKLANLLKTKKNKKPLLAACDVYRPAAIEQLRVVGEQVGVPVYMELENKNPVEIAMNAIREARAKGNDVVIVDTAGRLAIDEQMMKEIAAIKSAIQPDETLFVVDSMTGSSTVILAVVPLFLSERWSTNRSSSSERAKRWMLWISSTLNVWQTVSSVWVISFLWWNVRRSSMTKKRPNACRRKLPRISSTSTTLFLRSSRSRRWVT